MSGECDEHPEELENVLAVTQHALSLLKPYGLQLISRPTRQQRGTGVWARILQQAGSD